MSVMRLKGLVMTAVCAGLIGAVATDVQAFGGKKKKGGDCCDPCATAAFGGAGAYAGDCGPAPAPAPAPAAPAAPVTQKVKVTEWVPTWVEETVTVMKPVQRTETYTAHKWECVPETVTCQVTVNKLVTENVVENR